MATFNLTDLLSGSDAALSVVQGGSLVDGNTRKPSPRMVEVFFNCEDADINSGSGFASGDIAKVMHVPANTLVLAAGLEVLVAVTSGGSVTLDLDSGKAANLYVAAFDPTSIGHAPDANAGSQARLYTTTDTIDVTFNADTATAGRIRVWALVVDADQHVGNFATWTA